MTSLSIARLALVSKEIEHLAQGMLESKSAFEYVPDTSMSLLNSNAAVQSMHAALIAHHMQCMLIIREMKLINNVAACT